MMTITDVISYEDRRKRAELVQNLEHMIYVVYGMLLALVTVYMWLQLSVGI